MQRLLPLPKSHFEDADGNPLVAGLVYHYIRGTGTLKNTYQDSDGTVLNTNPIVLNARGEAAIFGTGTYRQRVLDVNGNLIWDAETGADDMTSTPGDFDVNGNLHVHGNLAVDGGIPGLGYTPPGTGALPRFMAQKLYEGAISPQDFGAIGDGSTDDTNAIRNWINAIFETGRPGLDTEGGVYKITGGQFLIDVHPAARKSFIMAGAGPQQTIFDVSACTSSPQMLIICSEEGGDGVGDAFYGAFRDFGVRGNSPGGIAFQVGRNFIPGPNIYPDAFNGFHFWNLVVNNNAANAYTAMKMNYVLNSIIHVTANSGGRSSNSAFVVAGVCFSTIYGAFDTANVGVDFRDGYSFGNIWLGIDFENVNRCIECNALTASRQTFIGGQFVWSTDMVVLNQCGGLFIFIAINQASGDENVFNGAMSGAAMIMNSPHGTLFQGGFGIVPKTGDAAVSMELVPGFTGYIQYKRDHRNRFVVGVNSEPESIGNLGSNFFIGRNDDNGLSIANAVHINRQTGQTTLERLAVTGQIGFFGGGTHGKPTVTGSYAAGTVLVSLVSALSDLGLITNATTA